MEFLLLLIHRLVAATAVRVAPPAEEEQSCWWLMDAPFFVRDTTFVWPPRSSSCHRSYQEEEQLWQGANLPRRVAILLSQNCGLLLLLLLIFVEPFFFLSFFLSFTSFLPISSLFLNTQTLPFIDQDTEGVEEGGGRHTGTCCLSSPPHPILGLISKPSKLIAIRGNVE